ncbi:PepSY domain-containing protein [Cupriavidus sp. UGS-1]|uniref:PepSY-associated TM helix domain-containing protein n=1 Tax=Cupriavidus sp. UGS-1 TaxID=2899826 RepID=UPI001E627FDD|nr:PepSY domain-containing protein [Cupriavidus sp. UGS-1]MCD9121143.1 PepSY domain-containing protein [Cupriavidus sp. UGS-1]
MPVSISQTRSGTSAAHRTLWRWHFYAGLFVMPFLIVLAITGTIYCFQPQIEPWLYPQLLRVTPQGEPLPAQTLLERARAAAPAGAVATTYTLRNDPRASSEFIFRLPSGNSESLYLNPYSGAVLGSLSVEDRLMKQVRMLHRALLAGKPGEVLMELAGCWTLVMIATGLAMWWPRLRESGVAAFRMRPASGRRGRWKEIHLLLGVSLAVGALLFVLSGLPWTALWGKQFKAITTAANLGRPADGGAGHMHAPARDRSNGGDAGQEDHRGHTKTMESLPLGDVPWATGLTAVPARSVASTGHAAIGLDRILAIVRARGAGPGCQVALPAGTGSVYSVSCFPNDPRGERTLHIDPHSGNIVRDIRYEDYGAVAKAVSYGTSLHMGRYFGMANQIVCAVISLGLMALAITGFIMWIKRKPANALGAPSRPASPPPMRAWVAGLAVLGAIFPLMGITMLVVWIIDRSVARTAGAPPEPVRR